MTGSADDRYGQLVTHLVLLNSNRDQIKRLKAQIDTYQDRCLELMDALGLDECDFTLGLRALLAKTVKDTVDTDMFVQLAFEEEVDDDDIRKAIKRSVSAKAARDLLSAQGYRTATTETKTTRHIRIVSAREKRA